MMVGILLLTALVQNDRQRKLFLVLSTKSRKKPCYYSKQETSLQASMEMRKFFFSGCCDMVHAHLNVAWVQHGQNSHLEHVWTCILNNSWLHRQNKLPIGKIYISFGYNKSLNKQLKAFPGTQSSPLFLPGHFAVLLDALDRRSFQEELVQMISFYLTPWLLKSWNLREERKELFNELEIGWIQNFLYVQKYICQNGCMYV